MWKQSEEPFILQKHFSAFIALIGKIKDNLASGSQVQQWKETLGDEAQRFLGKSLRQAEGKCALAGKQSKTKPTSYVFGYEPSL